MNFTAYSWSTPFLSSNLAAADGADQKVKAAARAGVPAGYIMF
jgi:hypothetical protein